MQFPEKTPVYTVGGSAESWKLIPNYMWEGIQNWIEYGIEPGDFLRAVFKNDLMEASRQADATNQLILFNYAKFLYTHAPTESYGSVANYVEWHKRKGLHGEQSKPEEGTEPSNTEHTAPEEDAEPTD